MTARALGLSKQLGRNFFLAQFSKELGKPPFHIADEALRALELYKWPGNVRELRNVMERAAVLAARSEIPQSLVRSLLPEKDLVDSPNLNLESAASETERKVVLRALMEAKDNKTAASLLGIGERTLWTKLKKHGLFAPPRVLPSAYFGTVLPIPAAL